MTSHLRPRPLAIAALVAACITVPQAQVRFGSLGLPGGAGLRGFMDGSSPITTSLDKALTAVDYLDGYAPGERMRLESQPQDEAGVFHAGPGAYEFAAQSFCMHAGTHGPGDGDGYLYAPLEGARASSIRHILQNAPAHREIPQQDIQVLVWAILARTPINQMPREGQATAARLLTPAELVELSAGSIGGVAPGAWRGTAPLVPPGMARVFAAESRLRDMLTGTSAAYRDLERVAVIFGDPEPDPDAHKVPRGRWSYHPGGYFIRFFPSGYDRTELQMVVPEPTTIGRDARGRLAGITGRRGARVEMIYEGGDAVPDGRARAMDGLRSIRFQGPDFLGGAARGDETGWMQIGLSRSAERRADLDERGLVQQAAAWQSLLSEPALGRAPRDAADVRDLVDLAQVQVELQHAVRASGSRMDGAAGLITEAWAAVFCEQAGGCVNRIQRIDAGAGARTSDAAFRFVSMADGARAGHDTLDRARSAAPRPAVAATAVDLSESVAVPAHRGRQRLGLTARSAR